MSFPDVSDEFETFFQPTRIFLFGKPFYGLLYDPARMEGEFTPGYVAKPNQPLDMPPKRVERLLRRGVHFDASGAKVETEPGEAQSFARIYSFSYEGHYYRLPRPLLFLVNSEGEYLGGGRPEPEDPSPSGKANGVQAAFKKDPLAQREEELRRQARARFSAKYTGVEARDWNFSNDVKVWVVDRKDLAVCLDVEIGNYQEILLDSMIASDRREEDRASRSRGDLIGRGAGSFRGDMIGPHQNK